MKTICFYFQVHQPWRLKRYRFFDMGRDHNYLDDLTNRSIMQKIARECYLPMNALLFNLIRQSEGRFRCTFSLTGLAVEQMRAYAPEVLDSFRRLARTGCVGVPGRNLLPFAGFAFVEGGFHAAGCAPYRTDEKGVRRCADRLSQYRTDLFRPDRLRCGRDGFQDHVGRGSPTRTGMEVARLCLCQCARPALEAVAAQLQASRTTSRSVSPTEGGTNGLSRRKNTRGGSLRTSWRGMWSISSWITKPSASTSVPIRVFSTL